MSGTNTAVTWGGGNTRFESSTEENSWAIFRHLKSDVEPEARGDLSS